MSPLATEHFPASCLKRIEPVAKRFLQASKSIKIKDFRRVAEISENRRKCKQNEKVIIQKQAKVFEIQAKSKETIEKQSKSLGI